ncbi:hypothetical protein C0J52_04894 [Blattella germanica]|nr:hypothetical protein C0J52_04894 [Blattella germanica]
MEGLQNISLGLKSRQIPITCVNKKKCTNSGPYILWDCELLEAERDNFRKSVRKPGGQWPIGKRELMDNHLKNFQNYINKINFDVFQII